METGECGIYSMLVRWNKFAALQFALVKDEQAIADASTVMETPGRPRKSEYTGL
jgi:hypothetical protein